MADGTNINDLLISAMELAQKWVDDVLENEPTGSAEDLIERRHKVYETAFNGIIETTRAGALKLAGR
jgi:hypothetical protein